MVSRSGFSQPLIHVNLDVSPAAKGGNLQISGRGDWG